MITLEMLELSGVLKSLTPEQKTAITELSKNDEATVIGTKIGALHGQYDADILNASGIAKQSGEKSYDYLKRVLGDYNSKLDSAKPLSAQVEKQKQKIAELEAKLADGSADEETKKQLKDARHQAAQLQSQLTAKEDEFNKAKADYEKREKGLQVGFAFDNATSKLKFKSDVSEPIKNILLAAAKDEILAKGTPDFVDDGKGGKKLVFRDAAGNTLNNPKNNLNPYTIDELVMETSLKDVVDTGKKQTGGGTGGNAGGGGGKAVTLDLSGIKTQQEADIQIENYLLSQGLTRDNVEFSNKALKIRNENNISELPIR